MRPLVLLSALTWFAASACAQESPRAKLDGLLKEFAQAQVDYAKLAESATTEAEQAKLFREASPQRAFVGRFLKLAQEHPADAVAYESLAWILQQGESCILYEATYLQAIDLLAAQHAKHAEIEAFFEPLADAPFAPSGKLLQAVFESHPVPAVRGRAGFHLGLQRKNFADAVIDLRRQPENAKKLELFAGADFMKQRLGSDTDRILRDAEEIFLRIQKEYAPVAYKRTTLGKSAEGELFELRHLRIGKIAPDIVGQDVDGKPLKLSDFRGKVVLVVFWGSWCGHCVAMLPQERTLLKRLEGEPFAIVGVNNDIDREKLKPFLKSRQITWPNIYDGDDALSHRWNVRGWPAIYLLDAQGAIRYKQVRGATLDRAVDELMKELKGK